MPEWSIGTVSKTVVRVTVPRVRIPVFPLIFSQRQNAEGCSRASSAFSIYGKQRVGEVSHMGCCNDIAFGESPTSQCEIQIVDSTLLG